MSALSRERERADDRLVNEAEKLVNLHQHGRAMLLLQDVRSRTPAHYPFEERSDHEWVVRCFNLPEFLAYVGELQGAAGQSQQENAPNIAWIGNAYARAAWLLAYIAVEQRDYLAALRYTEEGLALQPHAGRLVQERAQALNALSRFAETVALCSDALASGAVHLSTQRASILRARSYAQMELGDLDGAEASLTTSLELEPGNGTALHELEYLRELRAKRAKASVPPTAAPGMSEHHAQFALGLLPAMLQQGDSVLGILANPDNQDFPAREWDSLADRLPPGARVPAAGMHYASHWLGGEHLVIALQLPAPSPGAAATISHVVITTSPRIRCFAWERRTGVGNSLLEVKHPGQVMDHGPVGGSDQAALLHATCRLLGVAPRIEAPLLPQTFGMSRGTTMYMPHVPRASGEDARRIAALTGEARAAQSALEFPRAVALYESLLALRMATEGPENNEATQVHQSLAAAQAMAGDLAAAERTCRKWWAICRRQRMLAHAETLIALRELATWVSLQGRRDEGLEIMRYRAQLAGLARGAGSMQAEDAREGLARMERR